MSKNLKGRKGIEDLPKKEPIRNPEGWGKKSGEYHPIDGVDPWKRVKRLCDNNIGKPFDKVFSEYCSQVPVYQQHIFTEQFKENSYCGDYFVDEQGNIQKEKRERYKNKVIFYSDDYKVETRHKVSGKVYNWRNFSWWNPKFKKEDFEDVIVRGYAIEFDSKKNPEYIRLTTDQRKRRKAKAKKKAIEKEKKYQETLEKWKAIKNESKSYKK